MAEEKPKNKKGKKILKLIIMLILLAVLIVGGFALGIYLRLFDTQAANEKLGLYNLPIIGQYFVLVYRILNILLTNLFCFAPLSRAMFFTSSVIFL